MVIIIIIFSFKDSTKEVLFKLDFFIYFLRKKNDVIITFYFYYYYTYMWKWCVVCLNHIIYYCCNYIPKLSSDANVCRFHSVSKFVLNTPSLLMILLHAFFKASFGS